MGHSFHRRRSALIVGAASTVGFETARRLIEDDYRLYAAATDPAAAARLCAMGATPIVFDESGEESANSGLDGIAKEQGGVNVIVCFVGFCHCGAVNGSPCGDASSGLEAELLAFTRIARHFLPGMRRRGGGRIVVVAPMYGMVPTTRDTRCHTTWNTLQGLTDCLRIEVADYAVDVVLVEPGFEPSDGTDCASVANGAEAGMDPAEQHIAETEIVAAVVCHAIRAKRPLASYAVGSLAKPLVLAHKWLGEGMFGRLLSSRDK